MFYIDSADLIGYGFAIYLDKTGERTLTLSKLKSYGNAIVNELKNFHLLFEEEDINFFLAEHSDWFYKKSEDSIVLKDGISEDDLYNKFSEDFLLEESYSFLNNFDILLTNTI